LIRLFTVDVVAVWGSSLETCGVKKKGLKEEGRKGSRLICYVV
jgi:hypothetical protein